MIWNYIVLYNMLPWLTTYYKINTINEFCFLKIDGYGERV